MARRMPRSTTTEEDIIAADATGEAATEVEEVVREEREEVKPVVESLSLLREAGKRAPRLFGIPSGVEGLDDLFGLDAPNGSKHPASETRIRQRRLKALLSGELESADEETRTHMAGALAKLAYEEMRAQMATEETITA